MLNQKFSHISVKAEHVRVIAHQVRLAYKCNVDFIEPVFLEVKGQLFDLIRGNLSSLNRCFIQQNFSAIEAGTLFTDARENLLGTLESDNLVRDINEQIIILTGKCYISVHISVFKLNAGKEQAAWRKRCEAQYKPV